MLKDLGEAIEENNFILVETILGNIDIELSPDKFEENEKQLYNLAKVLLEDFQQKNSNYLNYLF